MYTSEPFVSEWNNLIPLYAEKGQKGVEERRKVNRLAVIAADVTFAGFCRAVRYIENEAGPSAWEWISKEQNLLEAVREQHPAIDLSSNQELEAIYKAAEELRAPDLTPREYRELVDKTCQMGRRSAYARQLACDRFLTCLEAGIIPCDIIDFDKNAESESQIRLLNKYAPLQSTNLGDYDELTLLVVTWKECANTVAAGRSRFEGISAVRIGLEDLMNQIETEFGSHNERIEKLNIQLDDPDRFWEEWRRAAPEVSDSMLHTNPLIFRASVIQRFMAYAERNTSLYPPEWNYLVSISPVPAEWHISSRKQLTTPPSTPDGRASLLPIPLQETVRSKKWVAILTKKGPIRGEIERFLYVLRNIAKKGDGTLRGFALNADLFREMSTELLWMQGKLGNRENLSSDEQIDIDKKARALKTTLYRIKKEYLGPNISITTKDGSMIDLARTADSLIRKGIMRADDVYKQESDSERIPTSPPIRQVQKSIS